MNFTKFESQLVTDAIEKHSLDSFQIVNADRFTDWHVPNFSPNTACMIMQVKKNAIRNISIILMTSYPDDHEIQIYEKKGLQDDTQYSTTNISLKQLASYPLSGTTNAIFVPQLPEGSSFEEFQEIIAYLRAPDGCPWDLKQTHQTLRSHLISETYEVLSAMDENDTASMQEEFGDLLLQIVLNAQIGMEANEFKMTDILRGIYTKIVNRHPHVFGNLDLKDEQGVLQNWEKLKASERAAKRKNLNTGDTENEEQMKGILDGVPLALPALIQAQEYQERVSRLGYPFPSGDELLKKISNKIINLKNIEEDQGHHLGICVFLLAMLASQHHIDIENSLREINAGFKNQIKNLETQSDNDHGRLAQMLRGISDELWK